MHTDFEDNNRTGFFCMKLVGFIARDNADYSTEMEKAMKGKCSYTDECPIYKKTIENNNGVQQKLGL